MEDKLEIVIYMDSKMKIAILVPNFSKYSGDARVAELQTKELLRKGNDVSIFALEGDIKIKGVKIFKLGMNKGSFFERIYRLLFPLDIIKIIKWIPKLKEYDLVISHLYPMNWLASISKKIYKTRYVFYNHGTNPPEHFPKLYERIYLKLYIWLNWLTTRNVDEVISVSNFAKKELKEQIGLDSHVKYNTINTNIFNNLPSSCQETKAHIRKKYGLTDGPLLLFVGRIAPQKKIDILIKVFKLIKQRLPTSNLIIIGEHSYEYYSTKIRKMADSSIKFVDSIKQDELVEYYRAADLYVTASYWESFNLPLAEAQACEKPAVVFDIGPHKEIISGNGKLIEKGDLFSFSKECITILNTSKLHEELPYIPKKKKICLVCSHGGHLTEILQLSKAFEGHEKFFITYDTVRTRDLDNRYLIQNIGRNPIRFLAIIPGIIHILRKEKPDIILSTGAEIAIPVFIIAKIFRIRTIFIESLCRIMQPSHTGRIVYPLSDIFLVQWESLLTKYGHKARFRGAVF